MKFIKTYKLFESTQGLTLEQVELLDKGTRSTPDQKNWKLNSQGMVDIHVGLKGFHYLGWGRNQEGVEPDPNALTDFKGIRFGEVGEQFLVANNELTSLEGSPHTVGGVFNCGGNLLTSLKGAPQRVGGHFICNKNPLKSLEGAPQEFGYNDDPRLNAEGHPRHIFDCNDCGLEDLKGSPQHVPGSFLCSGNPLKSLAGAPLRVDGDFVCNYFRLSNGEWNTTPGFLKVLSGDPNVIQPGVRVGMIIHEVPEKAKKLILPLMKDDDLDAYFIDDPLEMDILDEFPEIKAGVLKRTGLKDTSVVARSIRHKLI